MCILIIHSKGKSDSNPPPACAAEQLKALVPQRVALVPETAVGHGRRASQFALRAQRPCNTLWQAGAAAGSWFTCALHGLPPELAHRPQIAAAFATTIRMLDRRKGRP